MNFRITQFLTALRTAQSFLDENGATLTALNASGARAAFNTAVANVAALGEAQQVHALAASNERTRELRLNGDFRRTRVKPILRIARTMALDNADMAKVAAMPFRGNSTELVEAARVLAQQIAPHEAQFIAAGMENNFLADFNRAAEDLVASVTLKNLNRSSRVQSTAGIAKAAQAARLALGVVDGLVQRYFAAGSPALTAWKNACSVVKSTGPAAKPASPTSTTSPAPTAPAATTDTSPQLKAA